MKQYKRKECPHCGRGNLPKGIVSKPTKVASVWEWANFWCKHCTDKEGAR